MRLAAKLILLFLCGLFLIVGVFSYITLRRERDIAIEQHERYATEMAALVSQEDSESFSPDSQLSPTARIQIRRVEMLSGDSGNSPSVPSERLFFSQEVMTIAMADRAGNDRWYTYVPLSDANAQQTPGDGARESNERLEISAPDLDSNARTKRTLVSSILTLMCVSGLSAMVIYFGGVRMVGRPLDRLIEKVNRVAKGELDDPIEIRSHDELGDLSKAINSMCESLAMQRTAIETESAARVSAVEQLRHADRLRWVGRMAAGIAHEIGTPLNVVSGRAELIASGELSDAATVQSASAIKVESDRIAKTVAGLLEFAGQRPSRREPLDMREIVQTTVELMRPIAAKRNSRMITELPPTPVVAEIDRGQIQQVITNLVNNAIQSRPADAEVRIELYKENESNKQNDANDEFVVCRVSDNGNGIPEDSLEQIFEPFFTTKDVGEGTGLGLAISQGIIQEHGGEISVHSTQGRGTTFEFRFPTKGKNLAGVSGQVADDDENVPGGE